MLVMDSNSVDIQIARELLEFLEAYNLFGEHLVITIDRSSFSAAQLAKEISVVPAAISQWCNGKRFPTSGMVYKVSRTLKMNDNQRQSLIAAWNDTRTFKGYIEYLEEAIAEKDLAIIRELLELTFTQEDC